ncbi:MAG: ubiquinol-cytochrome c reductase iron-sulfur subunit [Proteobacteria bacterium]|nr:ubiquinol-cytochrome c reductase iron-sulfur subunit [Pseudomonadota bacterium]MBU1904595.1 ubiquinol-cytochrome c reductase iron-sulfur subunit [Pseudomonadota bacterium]
MKRRGFIKKGLMWASYVLGSAVFAYPALSFMSFRKITKRKVVFRPDEQQSTVNLKEGIYLTKEGDDFCALSARCTHLGCTLNYDIVSRRFNCPCHGSIFDLSGKWLSGPAKKNLDRILLTKKANGDVEVVVEI